ncbi:DUF1861 family protein [Dactylosporangium sp. AC04546]|uniref:DUF1861 family protein n=1 Tax=Dactylosporangium sp. AC04546 TaxID=2862460 RepID=UPI001EDD8B01|nr:DUF1861 family protein [Dactylosporangium sp. AC04546]WVK81549.1 DUF1861 family protein [Dactylosporangium sp. AC04546]
MRYDELVAAFERRPDRPETRLVRLPGLDGKLQYNPCRIAEEDRTLLAVRVESPGSYWRDAASWDPEVRFFEQTGDGWRPAPDTPVFAASEDPFAAWMRDRAGRRRLVFGVVTLDFGAQPPQAVTRFYAADGVASLDPAAPLLEVAGMKDIRLLQRDADVVVCGRPQGGRAGIGRISVAVTDSYESVTPELIAAAHIFADQVHPETKLGINELHDLGDGTVGALGHVAIGQEGSTQRYCAAWWTIDPQRLTATDPVVVATRSSFPPAPAKFDWLEDVVFPGSLTRLPDGRLHVVCGLGDAVVAEATLEPSAIRPPLAVV